MLSLYVRSSAAWRIDVNVRSTRVWPIADGGLVAVPCRRTDHEKCRSRYESDGKRLVDYAATSTMGDVVEVLHPYEEQMSTPQSSSSGLLAYVQSVVARAIPRRVRTAIFYKLVGVDKQFTVLSGMFSGMKYVDDSVGAQFYPKILGTYELELAAIVKSFEKRAFSRIIDVGAAEGYYAVGLALTNRQAHVVAFEATSEGMQLLRRMAKENRVEDRLEIKGYCTPEALCACLGDGTDSLVVMDVEGFEDQLIDLQKCPGLANAYLLIELHDNMVVGLGARLEQRLRSSHHIAEIWEQERTSADFPVKVSPLRWAAFGKLLRRSMKEHRGDRMRWFYCEPKPAQIH
jgi:hypothetical protein